MRRRTLTRTLASALAIAALASPAPRAQAAWLTWNVLGSAAAAQAGSWSPVQVPQTLDALTFGWNGTYDVSFDAPVDSLWYFDVDAGDVTFDLGTPLHFSAIASVAGSSGQTAALTVSGDTLVGGAVLEAGTDYGASGTVTVIGRNSQLRMDDGNVTLGHSGGTGTMSVVTGAGATIGLLEVGHDYGSTGSFVLSGRSLLPPFVPSSANVTTLWDGDYDGTGTVSVEQGAQLTAGIVTLAMLGYGSGTLSVGGASLSDSARCTLGLLEAAAGGDNITAQAGTGTITAWNGGVITAGSITLGGTYRGTGTLAVSEGARVFTGSLQTFAGGSLQQTGGLLQVGAGGMTLASGTLKVDDPLTRPTLELMNGGATTLTGTGAVRPLIVGASGMGTLRVLSGSTLTVNGDSPVIGQSANGNGEIDVNGGAVLSSDHPPFIGSAGVGSLLVTDGGQVSTAGALLGVLATGKGTLVVKDAATAVNLTDQLVLGGTPAAPSGSAGSTAIVSQGGVLRLARAGVAGIVYPNQSLVLDALGVLSMTGTLGVLDLQGDLDVQGGTVSGGTISMSGLGRIVGYGDVGASIACGSDTLPTIFTQGDLAIGRDDGPLTGVLFRGVLVAASTLTLRDPNEAVIRKVVLDAPSGRLVLPAGGAHLESGGLLYGTGEVQGALRCDGTVTATSPGTGLGFSGMLSGAGAVGGEVAHFLAGGGYAGTGGITSPVVFDSLSTLEVTGPVSVGRAALANAVLMQGRIHTGANALTLLSGSDVALGDSVVLAGGSIAYGGGASRFVLDGDAVLAGNGTVEGRLRVNGRLSPGFPAGAITVSGPLNLQGTYVAELGDAAGGECDLVTCPGAVTLGGVLDVRRLASFHAEPYDSFLVLSYGSHAGSFASVTFEGAPAAAYLAVHYHADGAWVIVLPSFVSVGDGPPVAAAALARAPVGSPGPAPALELTLPQAAEASLRLYDAGGREVAVLQSGALPAGRHLFALPHSRLPAGLLFARAQVSAGRGTWSRTARIVLIR